MFKTAQWALGSEAAQSLAKMAARSASGDPQLAALIRERQDLVAEWQKRDALRNQALARPSDQRDAEADAENTVRMAEIDRRIDAIDTRLAESFPDYAALARPAAISVETVQAQLNPDEALILFLDTRQFEAVPEESFAWVVTKTDHRWVRSELGKQALSREVAALRCGLDYTAWDGDTCATLTGETYAQADFFAGKPLPFDKARSHRLYKALFGEVEDMIEGKDLLLVPSGALTQLPFQVLVTEPPAAESDRATAWLVRDHALAVLPAVSSLEALRRVGKSSAATRPLIGFGNPLLNGPDSRYAKLARLARDKQTCRAGVGARLATLLGLRGGVTRIETRGGLADPSLIRRQTPLPETADELCAVARDIGADPRDIRLGASATEGTVKALSESGDLADYRIIHFATHGLTAGQLSENAEPGLLLTPPDKATRADDGYLSASEIASLKLDADWVILSACNTAAGNASEAEALSGLARAFFYAQARALLVSHWEVNSQAAVKLVTSVVRAIARDSSMGRSEALRQAMLGLAGSRDLLEAHPSYWAPFVVAGEGGRAFE